METNRLVCPNWVVSLSFVCVLALASANSALAGEQGKMAHEGHEGMGKTAVTEESMMAMRTKMHEKMEMMDQGLDALVAEMNAASGAQKVEAVAAVVSELVAQRKSMRGMMMHMSAGKMHDMKSSMGSCPMMQQSASDGEDNSQEHSDHHPKN